MGKRWDMTEQVDYNEIATNYKKWGEHNVSPAKIGHWNDMVDELANQKNIKALNTALYAMKDLDSGVDFNIVEYALRTLCKNSSTQAIIYRILYNFSSKGPEFLRKSDLFKSFDGLAESTKQNLDNSLIKAQEENEKVNI